MYPTPTRPTHRTLPLAVLVVLASLWLAGPLAAASVEEDESAYTPQQMESAEDVTGFLGQPVLTLVLTERNAIDAETVAVQETLRNGTLTVEIDWRQSSVLADGVVVELYPAQWTDFRGIHGTGREVSIIDRNDVDDFLVNRWNRTLCAYRDMVAVGQVTFPDGEVQIRTLGLTWQWSGAEMALEEMAAAANTSCPLNHKSAKCQNHVACVITVNCGIFSFDVDGRCLPQFPLGWPCLCDPLHDLVCGQPHVNQQTQN